MSHSPLYFSETLTVGKRTFLMEVRRSQRGQKYFIIQRTDLKDDEQEPVIIFDSYMTRFAGAIDRATRAMLNTVAEVEPADERRAKRELAKKETAKRQRVQRGPAKRATGAKKPTPMERTAMNAESTKKKPPNQGRRWTEEHDSLLIVHHKNGMPTSELAELLGRGEFSIEVRLAKLGLKLNE